MEGMPLWVMVVLFFVVIAGIFLLLWIGTQAGWFDKFGAIFTGGKSILTS
ncbi:MAG: hypothetical protein HY515_03480 [Candidatus Aenigmarchaeota archaeon]|nr:hypothetical protein [Candidatus Aenigmarchaeota archaeon]